MSGVITVSVSETKKSEHIGKIILTDYGMKRMLEKIVKGENFSNFNLNKISIGDKINTNYNSSITEMRHSVLDFEVSDKDMKITDNVFCLNTNLEVPGEVAFQEIGLFEKVGFEEYLFAYASGFSIIKSDKISYDLLIKMSLKLAFENEHYSKFEKVIEDPSYAKSSVITDLYATLTSVQLDLERAVTMNSKELGYNRAQIFYREQQNLESYLQNTLLFSRYIKLLPRISEENMTDCFIYPKTPVAATYELKNLRDYEEREDELPPSVMSVTNGLQITNRDNINFSRPSTFIMIGTINSMDKPGPILGKMNPDKDEYYFDFNVETTEKRYVLRPYGYELDGTIIQVSPNQTFKYLKNDVEQGPATFSDIFKMDTDYVTLFIDGSFKTVKIVVSLYLDGKTLEDKYKEVLRETITTDGYTNNEPYTIKYDKSLTFAIYSYDKEMEYKARKKKADEHKLVGHYKLIYTPDNEGLGEILTKENTYTFIYNGDTENPHIDFYINTRKVTTNLVEDKFNYMGPCEYYVDRCTLRNYRQTVSTLDYETPTIYVLKDIKISEIFVFKEMITPDMIVYLSLISQA